MCVNEVCMIQLKEIILRKVNNSTGIKAVELTLAVMSEINPLIFEAKTYISELDELVKNGEILELEYTLPNMDYRIKSIYFPKGTIFK